MVKEDQRLVQEPFSGERDVVAGREVYGQAALTALLIVFVCASSVPRDACTQMTARVYITKALDQPVCGGSALLEATRLAGTHSDEYARVRCVTR